MTEMITLDEIRERLGRHYGVGGLDRELLTNIRYDSHGDVGSVVCSLNGSPPKGYALYIPGHKMVSLYGNHGKRFRILRETRFEDRKPSPVPDECDWCSAALNGTGIEVTEYVDDFKEDTAFICSSCIGEHY